MGASIVSSLVDGVDGVMNIARGVAGTTISVDVPLSDHRARHAN
jgi:hypothetical protein